MSEILVKTATRHRASLDPYFMKDWTAFDVLQIMPDGYFTKNKYGGAKRMGIVLRVEADIPSDYAYYEPTQFNPYHGRTKLIVDLTKILTDQQLKDVFNHDLLVAPIYIGKSYIDLFEPRENRTIIHPYDKSASFDNETVDVGPNGDADANTFLEFESNVAINVGGVIGLADESFNESGAITVTGTGSADGKAITFRTTGAARHEGKWTASAWYLSLTGDYSYIFTIADAYVNLDGLQLFNNTTVAGGICSCSHTGELQVYSTIAKCVSPSDRAHFLLTPGASTITKFRNNLLYDGFRGIRFSFGNAGQTIILYNNTVINFSDDCIHVADSVGDVVLYLINNLCQDGTTDFEVTTFTSFTHSGNISKDTSSPDVALREKTPTFVDANADDYHLAVGDTVARGNGTDLSEDAQWAFEDDIDGDTRVAWDIGADEYVGAGGETIILDAITGSISTPNISLSLGAVQLAMDALSAVASAPNSTLSPGAVQLLMDALTGSASAPNTSLSLGAVQLALNAISASGSAPGLTLSLGEIQILLDALSATGSAENITLSVAITILLDALNAAGSAQSISLSPGEVQIILDALSASASAEDTSITLAGLILLNALSAIVSTPGITLSMGEVQIALNVLSASGTAENIILSLATIIVLNALSATGSAEGITLSTGQVQILLDALSGTSSTPKIILSPGQVAIALDALAAAAQAQNLSVTLASIIALNALTASATAQSMTLSLGEVAILLAALELIASAPDISIRTVTTAALERLISVLAENRVITIAAENRFITIPAEDRTKMI